MVSNFGHPRNAPPDGVRIEDPIFRKRALMYSNGPCRNRTCLHLPSPTMHVPPSCLAASPIGSSSTLPNSPEHSRLQTLPISE